MFHSWAQRAVSRNIRGLPVPTRIGSVPFTGLGVNGAAVSRNDSPRKSPLSPSATLDIRWSAYQNDLKPLTCAHWARERVSLQDRSYEGHTENCMSRTLGLSRTLAE